MIFEARKFVPWKVGVPSFLMADIESVVYETKEGMQVWRFEQSGWAVEFDGSVRWR